ncbi:MAG: hypothetical protein AAFQ43_07195 [Bacteroidota bacterium]
MKIACPKCTWEPTASARWTCRGGHSWNAFDTGGTCPACQTTWTRTQCLRCAEWSLHVDWYHDLPPVDALFDLEEAPRYAS